MKRLIYKASRVFLGGVLLRKEGSTGKLLSQISGRRSEAVWGTDTADGRCEGRDPLMATSVIHNEEQGVIGINSLDELISSSDHMIAFRTNQNIPIGTGGIVLEAYARGVFVGGTTGCLMAVGYGAALYAAFYTDGQWKNAKKFTWSVSQAEKSMANSTIPFNVGELKYNGILNSSHNLNDLVDGIYYIQTPAPENAPVTTCVWCILIQITPTSSMVHQYVFKPVSAVLWMRERSGNPSVWLNWTKVVGTAV